MYSANLVKMNEEDFLARSNELLKEAQEHLTPGEAYTYPQLCRRLGETPARGNTKKRHLRQLQRIFDFEVDENYYIISGVYNEVQPPVRRTRSDGKFTNYIEYLLLNDLYLTEGHRIEHTMKEWWARLRMINVYYAHNYRMDNRNTFIENLRKFYNEQLSERDIDYYDRSLDRFYSRTGSKFARIFRYTLDKLEDMRFLTWEYVFMVGNSPEDVYEADDDEVETWLKCERKALARLGLKRASQLVYASKEVRDRYFSLVNNYKEEFGGWKYSFKAVRVIFTKTGMDKAIQESDKSIEETRGKLNKMSLMSVNEQAIRESDKMHLKNNADYSPLINCYETFYGNEILSDEKIKEDTALYAQLLFANELIACGENKVGAYASVL